MNTSDLLCFSGSRWSDIFHRPNQLMVRFARRCRTYFVEPPRILDVGERPRMEVEVHRDGPRVCVPWIQPGLGRHEREYVQRTLLDQTMREQRVYPRILWFCTPMALGFADELEAPLTVYDCSDDVAARSDAPPESIEREQTLFDRADLVFTDGESLFHAKRDLHPNIHCFPSSAADPSVANSSWDETYERMMDRMTDTMLTGRRSTSTTREDVGTRRATSA